MQSGEKSLLRSFARPLVGRLSFPRTRPSHLFSETGTPYGAAWKVRPSGPDRGLHRAAAYVPANTNTNVGTQASTHWRGISLSAPHVGFDCETLERVNVKGVPRQETFKRCCPFRLISAY